MNKDEGKPSSKMDRDTAWYIFCVLAYHVPIVVFMLWAALSDQARFERVANDPDNKLTIILVCIALLLGSVAVSYFALPRKRSERDDKKDGRSKG